MAPATIDRRPSTVCGFYRFAHIDGRIGSNPAQNVRRPKVHPSQTRGLDRGELGNFLFTAERFDRAHAALAVLLGLNGLRVSEACAAKIEDLAVERGHRTLRFVGKGNKPAVIPLAPPTARTSTWWWVSAARGRSCYATTGGPGQANRASLGPIDRQKGRARAGTSSHVAIGVHHGRPRCRRPAARSATRSPTRQPATVYDHRRQNFDKHPAYVVVAFVTGG